MEFPEIIDMMKRQETRDDAREILNRITELVDQNEMPPLKAQALSHIVGVRNSIEKGDGPDNDKPWL